MVDLVSAARTASAIKKLVEQDLADVLAQLDLNAAARSLSALDKARDKRAVYWSAINHIESGEEKLRSGLNSGGHEKAAQMYFQASALKALLYRYLGEEELARKCFEDSKEVMAEHNRLAATFMVQMRQTVAAWNPGFWFDSPAVKAARVFRPSKFWEAFGYPGPHFFSLDTFLEDRISTWEG
jgi:hypothetical protein